MVLKGNHPMQMLPECGLRTPEGRRRYLKLNV